MSKERWIGADDPSQSVSCPGRLRSEPLVLVAAPADQVGIYPLQVAPQYLRRFGASAVADDIVRVPLEPDVGKAPSHPHVEDVVQKQIREAGTYHPTLRSSRCARHDATVLQLCRRLQPALDVEKHPAAVSMFADRLQEQLPVDAIEIAPHINV